MGLHRHVVLVGRRVGHVEANRRGFECRLEFALRLVRRSAAVERLRLDRLVPVRLDLVRAAIILVVDADKRRRMACRLECLGDDKCHGQAVMADTVILEHGLRLGKPVRRLRLAVGGLLGCILVGEDQKHAWRQRRHRRVHGGDPAAPISASTMNPVAAFSASGCSVA